jgi:hypothetical protein
MTLPLSGRRRVLGFVEWVMAIVGLSALGFLSAGEPTAARSVHLGWLAPEGNAFYNEMVVEQSTPGSYFMACGWDTGYFGIQELMQPGRKVAIFSVWDPTSGDNPNAVTKEDRVELLHSHPAVRIKRFGGEGTGGQCMMDFPWTLGSTNRFLVRGSIQGEKTAYSGYLWDSAKQEWMHLVTFRTRTGGRPLKGYYSFVEDFRRDGKSVQDLRRARFGGGMVLTTQGEWQCLLRARFTASGAEWESKENIDGGLAKEGFFLATGGSIQASRPLRSVIARSPLGMAIPGEPAPQYVQTDFSKAPECESFAREATRIAEEWYPRLTALLSGPDQPLPYPVVKLSFDRFDGIAETGANSIRVSAEWVTTKSPKDYGMIVHELCHVVQDYKGKGEGWVTEGIADYVRYALFEPQSGRLNINAGQSSYRDGYGPAAALLAWLEKTRQPGVVRKLNVASREGRLQEQELEAILGGTPDSLWKDFVDSQKRGR